MGAQQTNNMSSSSLLSMVMLVAILHASSAFPTSVDDDNLVYAEWLKQENSKQGDSRSSEANQGSQFSIRAHRRSGAGSGSGSGSGTPPPTPTAAAPTPPPTAAATTVASSTVDTTSTTTKTATQTIKVTVNGNAAAFNANTAQKESTCCGIGVLAGTMTQTDGVCAHKTGTNTQCAAADPVRRGAVIITVTYTVDSAVASITLTTVVDSTSAMTLTTLTDAIAAVIAANPTWQGSVTAPTITEIQVATLTTPAATSSDSDNTGIIIGAVVGAIVGIAIIAGIAFFIMKKDSNPSPAQVEPFDNKVGVRAQ